MLAGAPGHERGAQIKPQDAFYGDRLKGSALAVLSDAYEPARRSYVRFCSVARLWLQLARLVSELIAFAGAAAVACYASSRKRNSPIGPLALETMTSISRPR
jgi:hypothetical protein